MRFFMHYNKPYNNKFKKATKNMYTTILVACISVRPPSESTRSSRTS